MFNPERLLGGLIRSGMRGGTRRGSSLGGLAAGGAALGLLGVAMEAFEHYTNKGPAVSPAPGMTPGPPPALGAAPPPPPGGVAAPPPPPPGLGAAPVMPPPAPSPPATAPESRPGDAVLLIRAMIAAANADGVIDEKERNGILDKLQELNPSREDQQFIIGELMAPKSRQSIVAAVESPQTARQVYLVSLLAIEVDTDAERQYLADLADELGLDAATVVEIHLQAGLSMD
jgi:uncharacterized membrane protein YebE (DUF533 family)